jgi:hypothetical protein
MAAREDRMSRIKDPIEKMRRSLERDHRVFALQGNKSFRTAWRLKKAKASRRVRRAQARELLKSSRSNGAIDGTERNPKRSLRKLGVMSLSQAIEFKDGPLSSRWSLRILCRNKKALEASLELKKRPRRK